jgi:hypothetical protein
VFLFLFFLLFTSSLFFTQLKHANNFSEFVAEQNAQIKQRRRRRRNVFMSSNGPQELRSFDVFAYNHYDVIVNHLKAIASYKPEMVTFYNITKTFENRDMVGLKVSHSIKFS